jgi:hypothetical protein
VIGGAEQRQHHGADAVKLLIAVPAGGVPPASAVLAKWRGIDDKSEEDQRCQREK